MSQRRKGRAAWLSATAVAVALVVVAGVAFAGPVATSAGFQGDDGNLADDGADASIDWNSFTPVSWTGTAPYRQAQSTEGAYSFTGVEDDQTSGTDTAFAGGTKQDDECATVKAGPKPPNKDDLKRAYFADATVTVGTDDHIFLALAWVRIAQNTTSASAHVGFEFNQSDVACGPASDGLVERTEGDLLVVYDFEGGSGDLPTLTSREWVLSGACEVGSSSPPCWGPATNLTAGGFAEARVNTSVVGPVVDALAPTAVGGTTNQTLQLNEFGEAIIDLTDAEILDASECFAFGKAYAVSRSSGNSAQAQMKDLAGPGEVDIKNCGSVIIRKETDPDEDPNATSFDYDTTGELDASEDATAEFSLMDDGSKDYGDAVFAGSYGVSERDPSPNYALQSIDCSASDTTNGSTVTPNVATRTVSFTLAAEDTIDCTFTNELQQGALVIEKRSTKTNNPLVSQAGAVFSYDSSSVTDNGVGDEDTTVGEICVSGLAPGDYEIDETSPPPGYGDSDDAAQTVTVVAGTDCEVEANRPGEGATATFTNPPLADLLVRVDGQESGEIASTIDCGTTGGVTPAVDPAVLDVDDLEPQTITCTIVIDP